MSSTTPSGVKRYVIVGNSAAAIHAVKAIRRADPEGGITLIGSEKHHAYSPVLLTYYVAGKIQREALFIADRAFYRQHRVDLNLGVPAVGIDPKAHRLQLSDGRQVTYDRLLIATGSTPKQLNIRVKIWTGCWR